MADKYILYCDNLRYKVNGEVILFDSSDEALAKGRELQENPNIFFPIEMQWTGKASEDKDVI